MQTQNRLWFVLALAFSTSLTACGWERVTQVTEVNSGSGPVAVTSVTITPDSVGLHHGTLPKCIGQTFQLNATVMPMSASQVLIWYSNDTRVANVGPSGLVTVVGVGTATVSATSATNSNMFATTKVVVTSPVSCNTPPPPPIDTTHHASGISVVLQPLPLPFHLGTNCSTNQTYQLIWEVKKDGMRHSNQNVTFSSVQNNGVVSWGSTGLVHPLKAGTALIVATAVADTMAKDTTMVTVDSQACSGGSATASITVVAPAGTTMRVGTSQQLSVNVVGAADQTGTWSSSNQQFILVNSQSGIVTAFSVGSSRVCFSLMTNPTNISQGCINITS